MQPVNDGHSFWDHLSVTRADEYAREEELSRLPIPPAPVNPPQPAPQKGAVDPRPFNPLPSPPLHFDADDGAWPADPSLSAPVQATPVRRWPAQTAAPVSALPVASAPLLQPARKGRRLRGIASGRLAYRVQRLWLTPLIRRALTLGLPVGAVLVSLAVFLMDEGRRAHLMAQADAAYALVVDRDEFMVTELELVQTLPPAVEAAIREVIAPELPQSSFRLDLGALRVELERLDAIRLADLRLTAEGKLAIGITQRVPAILWRSTEGTEVLDAEGVRIGFVTDRSALPDLPLVAGDGANRNVGEALDLIEAASPLGARVLGLVRMGERRWDVVLDRDQIIRLPEMGAIAALERTIALEQAQDLLARDVLVADLRNPARPVLQVSAGALETIRALRGTYSTERVAQ
jgi:cell division septal protein FtsQ